MGLAIPFFAFFQGKVFCQNYMNYNIYDFSDFHKGFLTSNLSGSLRHFLESFIAEASRSKTNRTSRNATSLTGNKEDIADSIVIVLGNGGIGFKGKYAKEEDFTEVNKFLHDKNCHLLFIRGNEDDPSIFNGNKIGLSNIHLVKDYSLLKVAQVKFLCVGGSISLDREWKKMQEKKCKNGPLWFENEAPIFNKEIEEEILSEHKINGLLTATAPIFGTPSLVPLSKWEEQNEELFASHFNARMAITNVWVEIMRQKQDVQIWIHSSFNNSTFAQGCNNLQLVSVGRASHKLVSLHQMLTNYTCLSIAKKEKSFGTLNDLSTYYTFANHDGIAVNHAGVGIDVGPIFGNGNEIIDANQ